MIDARKLILILAAGLVLTGPVISPWHAHDTDGSRSCRLCQTERAPEPDAEGLRSVPPILVDLGATPSEVPIPEAIDVPLPVLGRAPPSRV
jgi:hypothetical protein